MLLVRRATPCDSLSNRQTLSQHTGARWQRRSIGLHASQPCSQPIDSTMFVIRRLASGPVSGYANRSVATRLFHMTYYYY